MNVRIVDTIVKVTTIIPAIVILNWAITGIGELMTLPDTVSVISGIVGIFVFIIVMSLYIIWYIGMITKLVNKGQQNEGTRDDGNSSNIVHDDNGRSM